MTLPKSIKEVLHTTRTTAFRYSLMTTLVASVITCISMMMIYQTAQQEIADQVDSRLISEALRLRRNYEYRTTLDLYTPPIGITERVKTEPNMSYCITPQTSTTDHLAGREQRNMVMLDTSFNNLCLLHDNLEQNLLPPPSEFDLPFITRNENNNIMRVIITPIQNKYALIIGYDTHNERKILRGMITMALFATLLLVLASFFGSLFISRTITNTIARISRSARRIADGDFGERIPVKPSDSNELRALAGDLNHMLERIDNLITSQRQVTNNIAHDLRSPLNRLRSRMEVALLDKKRSCEELREVVAESIEDAERLLQTFNAMLSIAQVESRARDDFIETDLSRICEDLAEMYDVLAEDGLHTFSSQIEPNLHVQGNRQLIAQAITNLLDNAVKYTPNGGNISLEAYKQGKHITVAVADNGPGIPEQDRERVLQRFVRLDSARSTPGNGLGLSLVSAVINLHGGEICLTDNHPGLKIKLIFPEAEAFLSQYPSNKKTNPLKKIRLSAKKPKNS
ncbi:sensor histidine kinase [Suttonella ornithocola]|uniref:histidine kinase n=1 Tax=Suttonella ornithocola TaxID=279832 RepID=A0A380MXJ5_9GAMM|nr:ATP-binding protein [Suttonella ornithocola]SUO97279.1 Sensor kinase CusS [Suttonella ornithocola]